MHDAVSFALILSPQMPLFPTLCILTRSCQWIISVVPCATGVKKDPSIINFYRKFSFFFGFSHCQETGEICFSFQNFQGPYKSCISAPASLNLKQGNRAGGRVVGGRMGMSAQMGDCTNLITEEAWQIMLKRSLLSLFTISSVDFEDALCNCLRSYS